jgi:hypothetical protein
MLPRQARVRSEFSERYSKITPGEWHHAMWVREMALADRRKGVAQQQGEQGQRILPDEHFEFQGGWSAEKGIRGVERRMLRSDG